MASDDQIKFSLDLDASGFKEGIEGAKTALEAMGKSSKSIDGALSSLKEMAQVAATLYGAFKILQGVVNTTFEAENIKAVNQQFEILSKNAGIAGDALRSGLEEAAGGLIDDTDLLQGANKAIVAMGESANKLPQIMELARKATAAFGGDLQQNFEAMTQAVSTGNARMLKQMGIVIDADAAVRNYALSIGKSIGQLTEAERRQATLNAVLEKGKTAFKGIDDSVREGQNTWKQTQVAIGQIGEALTLAFDKTFGDVVRKYLSGIRDIAVDTKKFVEYLYGTESNDSKVSRLNDELMQTKARIIDLERGDVGVWDLIMGRDRSEEIAKAKAQVVAVEAEINGLKAKATEAGAGAVGSGPEAAPVKVDYEAMQAKTRFEADMLKMQEQSLEFDQTKATNEEVFNQLEIQRRSTLEAQKNAEMEAQRARYDSGLIDKNNFELQKQAIDLQYAQQIEDMRRTESQRRIEVYENELKQAQNVGQGIGAAFRQGGAEASAAMSNFGNQGKMVFNSFQKNAVSSLQAFGAGTQTAAEAAKGFLFGMLADVAEGYGRMMMLTAFESFPAVNVPKLAAGAALVALSGFLRAQGASGGGGGMSSAGGGGGGGFGGGFGGGAPDQNVAAQEQQKKAVTIAIQGNYFDTDQSRLRLLEMVREASDATDYRYVQIGGTN
jgi:hypothetical protein